MKLTVKDIVAIVEKNNEYKDSLSGYDEAYENLNSRNYARVMGYIEGFNARLKSTAKDLKKMKNCSEHEKDLNKKTAEVLDSIVKKFEKAAENTEVYDEAKVQLIKLVEAYREQTKKEYLEWLKTEVPIEVKES